MGNQDQSNLVVRVQPDTGRGTFHRSAPQPEIGIINPGRASFSICVGITRSCSRTLWMAIFLRSWWSTFYWLVGFGGIPLAISSAIMW